MLNREQIKNLRRSKTLIENFIDLETQLTPNGFDLTVEKIFGFEAAGALDFSNSERIVPAGKEIKPKKGNKSKYGWWELRRGAYRIKTNESINLPKNLIAVAFPRSSLLRMGAYAKTGVWDAGFSGKSEFLLVVGNPKGIRIKQNARVAQIVFEKIRMVKMGYEGIYKKLL